MEAAPLSFVSNKVIICCYESLFFIYGMWIPVSTETTVSDILGKWRGKQVQCTFVGKEREIQETQVRLQSAEMLGKLKLSRKQEIFFVVVVGNSKGQVLLEVHLSEIREFLSRMADEWKFFCPNLFDEMGREGGQTFFIRCVTIFILVIH